MNADISFNSRVANQASFSQSKIHKHLNSIAEKLEVDKVEIEKAEPQLSENNTWLANLAKKLEALDGAL